MKNLTFILTFVSLFVLSIFTNPLDAEASTIDGYDAPYGYVKIHVPNPYGEDYDRIIINKSEGRFYASFNYPYYHIGSTSKVDTYDKTANGRWVKTNDNVGPGSNMATIGVIDNITQHLVKTDSTIYSGTTGNGVFFYVAPPSAWEVAQLSGVEEIPGGIVANLVDGGLLLVALMVFAILLGIYWVARYLRSRVL